MFLFWIADILHTGGLARNNNEHEYFVIFLQVRINISKMFRRSAIFTKMLNNYIEILLIFFALFLSLLLTYFLEKFPEVVDRV